MVIHLLRVLITLIFIGLGACTVPSSQLIVIPVTSKQVTSYTNAIQNQVLTAINSLASIPDSQRSFVNTMKPWNLLANDLLASLSTLHFTSESKLPSQQDASDALNSMIGFLYASISLNNDVHHAFISLAEKALSHPQSFNSYEMYEIANVLTMANAMQPVLSTNEHQAIGHLLTLAEKADKTPYLYKKGLVEDKEADEPIKVLNLNVCFLPGENAYYRGGAKPWQERVSALAEQLIAINSDIICLQEVFADDAGEALYEALKNHYSHFYLNIGSRPLGFSLEQLGLPSGLFVASKYPVKMPNFEIFTVTGFPMNYGVFDFVVDAGIRKAHIYNTHLKSLNDPHSPTIRAGQLQEIIDKMDGSISLSDPKIAFLLVGDLNIPWGQGEPGSELINQTFIDDYNKNREKLEQAACTCTDYYTDYFFRTHDIPLHMDANFQIIDYALLLKKDKLHAIQTKMLRMNDLADPDNILTDHNALLTIIHQDEAVSEAEVNES